MKKITFVSVAGTTVLATVLSVAGLGGAAGAAVTDARKKPSPTPTATATTPPPVVDGPDCANALEAHLFWHRDVVQGSAAKLNAGELAAVIYLASDSCPNERYVFEILDAATGTNLLASTTVTGADHNTVNLTKFFKLGADGTIAVDTFDDVQRIRLQLKVFNAAGTLLATAPSHDQFTPPGAEIIDDDNGSPALNGFH